MKKLIALSILFTSILTHAIETEKLPFLSRCELYALRSTEAYLTKMGDFWHWQAYDANFPWWRMTLNPGNYNVLALRSNDWAQIRQSASVSFEPPKLDISDFTEEDKARIGKLLEEQRVLESTAKPPTTKSWDWRWSAELELMVSSYLSAFSGWREMLRDWRNMPEYMKAYCGYCTSGLREELESLKEAWKHRNDPPEPRPPVTVTLYRDLKLFGQDGKVLKLRKGDVVTLGSDRLVTNVVKAAPSAQN